MNAKWIYLILLIAITHGCFVSSVKTISKKETCPIGNILLVSRVFPQNENYIKDLCADLNGKLTKHGYNVTEYVSERYDSLSFWKICNSFNPNSILFIFPEKKFVTYSTGFIELTYSIELQCRKDSLNKTIYNGLIKVAYREDKRDIIIEKATEEIFNAVFSR